MPRMNYPIALVKNPDRNQAVKKALTLLGADLQNRLKSAKRVVIKVNFVSAHNQLAATHADAVRAFLDFARPLVTHKTFITEIGVIGANQGFDSYGYKTLEKEFDVSIGSYTPFGFSPIKLFDRKMILNQTGYFAKAALESDFLISITPAKTHDTGIVTLSLKNIGVGFLKNPSVIHQGYQAFNKNLYLLAKKRAPELAIIDATEAMEGNGPASGSVRKAGWVLASLNAVQADVTAAHLMGFNPEEIGYLHYLLEDGLATTDWPKLNLLGAKLESCRESFYPHRTYREQLKWQLPPNLRQEAAILARKIITALHKD